ncbi:MAG TPA: DUF4238 domain-containing protein [Aquella sp.]|nr:DUF4238 domain-containing protein [Aquella sp.]
MQKTVNQHYVPQLLLKKFAKTMEVTGRATKYQLQVYDKNTGKHRIDLVSNIFSQKYFYDTDNQIESSLSKLETKVAPIINKLIAELSIPTNLDLEIFLKFICCQYLRTLTMRERSNQTIDKIQMDIVKSIFEANKDSPLFKEMFETGKIDYGTFMYGKEAKRSISCLNIQNLNKYYKGLKDLEIHILENNTSKEFIIGDHPVILCNWLLSDYKLTKNIPVNSSPVAIGAQMFIPITPRLTIGLYDPKVYRYDTSSKYITSIDEKSVEWLNTLQIFYSTNSLCFLSESMIPIVASLVDGAQNLNLCRPFDNDTYNQVVSGHILRNLEPKPSFFETLDTAMQLLSKAVVPLPDTSSLGIIAGLLYRNQEGLVI